MLQRLAGLPAFDGGAIGRGAGAAAVRVAVRPAAEEEEGVGAVDLQQVGHVVDVDAAAGDGPGGLQPAEVLVEVDAVLQVGLDIPLAQDVDDAQRCLL